MAEGVKVSKNFFGEMKVNLCEVTGKVYKTPVNGAVSISNTFADKWEIDLKVGPEYLKTNNIKPLPMSEVEAKIRAEKGKLRLEV